MQIMARATLIGAWAVRACISHCGEGRGGLKSKDRK